MTEVSGHPAVYTPVTSLLTIVPGHLQSAHHSFSGLFEVGWVIEASGSPVVHWVRATSVLTTVPGHLKSLAITFPANLSLAGRLRAPPLWLFIGARITSSDSRSGPSYIQVLQPI